MWHLMHGVLLIGVVSLNNHRICWLVAELVAQWASAGQQGRAAKRVGQRAGRERAEFLLDMKVCEAHQQLGVCSLC